MKTAFLKMHGLGNDFVILDARAGPLGLGPARAAALADRRAGIGCDQLIVLEPSARADVFMRIRNADGGEVGACGNATRCVADLLHRATGRRAVAIETVAGVLAAEVLGDGRVRVDMGAPGLAWGDVPLAHPMDTLHVDLPGDPAACSMGNPHATFFVADVAAMDIARDGPALEHHALFPERANIGYAQMLSPERIRLRVWERGAGLTPACGSGACAALVNAHRRGLAARRAVMVLDGGELEIAWRDDGHVLMAGPVAVSFEGTVDLSTYPA